MELTVLCKELNNWFELEKHFGVFHIENGSIKEDVGLVENQYFRIVGSIFNDGVHVSPATNLVEETFEGPYNSESFGGYSYTKSSGYSGNENKNGSNNALSMFADELNRWRKV